MATVTYYIRSHYDPEDRAASEVATGQTSTTSDSHLTLQDSEEPEEDPWQTESAFGAERRLAAAPRFVPAVVSYDEVNNMLGGFHRTVLQPPAEKPKEDVGGWYRSLTRRSQIGASSFRVSAGDRVSGVKIDEALPATSRSFRTDSEAALKPRVASLRADKNNWFIARALHSEQTSTPFTPPLTLADILAREPPVSKQPVAPPVFLALGPSNKGWGMLQQSGWSEGEGLGANVARRRMPRLAQQMQPGMSSSIPQSNPATTKMRDVEVVDLTLSDSDEDDEVAGEEDVLAVSGEPSSFPMDPSPHSVPLLTPIATVLKSDRLGIGLKAKKVGPHKASKRRVTHNQAALAAHVRANEDMRRMKALIGRGSRGFARLANAESEQRRQLLASLNDP
ncbi:hypothetical protein BC835DRAFT_1269733 [Cytidiella melzeri]|nr:hypothetical protein BC835DRAFT_1269733 [Cytidiella melzeri]